MDRDVSPSAGRSPSLTPSSLRSLAARHGIRPRKALGQHFLIEPSLARRITELAGVGPGDVEPIVAHLRGGPVHAPRVYRPEKPGANKVPLAPAPPEPPHERT